jgi:hypothetical protein
MRNDALFLQQVFRNFLVFTRGLPHAALPFASFPHHAAKEVLGNP